MKIISLIFLSIFLSFSCVVKAQEHNAYELAIGGRFQKTVKLYWENGIGTDFCSEALLHKKLHLKLSYASSRLGSAFNSNAVKQDNYGIGLDWRFRAEKNFQIFTGFNSGFFHAEMEDPMFDILPHNSLLLSAETGFSYKFKVPMAISCSAGYNMINGNGIDSPGTLFPLFYQISAYYLIRK
jgi:hypothetical protein